MRNQVKRRQLVKFQTKTVVIFFHVKWIISREIQSTLLRLLHVLPKNSAVASQRNLFSSRPVLLVCFILYFFKNRSTFSQVCILLELHFTDILAPRIEPKNIKVDAKSILVILDGEENNGADGYVGLAEEVDSDSIANCTTNDSKSNCSLTGLKSSTNYSVTVRSYRNDDTRTITYGDLSKPIFTVTGSCLLHHHQIRRGRIYCESNQLIHFQL